MGLTSNRGPIYTFRRILTIIPLFIGISVITFALMYMIGDPLVILFNRIHILLLKILKEFDLV